MKRQIECTKEEEEKLFSKKGKERKGDNEYAFRYLEGRKFCKAPMVWADNWGIGEEKRSISC